MELSGHVVPLFYRFQEPGTVLHRGCCHFLPQNKVGGLGFRHCFPFPRSLCVECLVMATVTGTRKYLAALLISSPSNECYGIYVKRAFKET